MRQWGIVLGLIAVFGVSPAMAKENVAQGWVDWLKSYWSGNGQPHRSKSPKTSAKYFRVAGDGSCPSFKELKRLKGVRNAKKGLGYSFVIAPSAKLYIGSSNSDRAVMFGRVQAFAKVRLYGAYGNRVLVAHKNHTTCGWISREALLGTLTPKADRPAECDQGWVFNQLKKGRKAMRSGPPQLMEACLPKKWRKGSPYKSRAITQFDLTQPRNQKISFYISPGALDKKQERRKPEIFDIFAMRQVSSKSAENGLEGTYFLLGNSTVTGKRIRGWVHEKDIRIWSNRLAVYWAGTGRGKASLNGKVILKERYSTTKQRRAILPRFPLIDDGSLSPRSGVSYKKFGVMFMGRNVSKLLQVRSRIKKKETLRYWMMLQDDEWEMLRKTFADACSLFHPDKFDDETFEEFKDVFVKNAQPINQCNTIRSCLRSATFSKSKLKRNWNAVKENFDDYDDQEIEILHKKFCRTSFLLERIDKDETIGTGTQATPYNLKRLRWDNDEERWLVQKRFIRRFDWKHKFPSGMLFYYVPIEFLS